MPLTTEHELIENQGPETVTNNNKSRELGCLGGTQRGAAKRVDARRRAKDLCERWVELSETRLLEMSIQAPPKLTRHVEPEQQRRHFPSQHVGQQLLNTTYSGTKIILHVGHPARRYLMSHLPWPGERKKTPAVEFGIFPTGSLNRVCQQVWKPMDGGLAREEDVRQQSIMGYRISVKTCHEEISEARKDTVL
jgi:hypothetical protein